MARGFVDFFFPELSSRFDWSAGFPLLPTELAQPGPGAAAGPRRADLVFRVRLAGDVAGACVLLVEAQAHYDRDFARDFHEMRNCMRRPVLGFQRIAGLAQR